MLHHDVDEEALHYVDSNVQEDGRVDIRFTNGAQAFFQKRLKKARTDPDELDTRHAKHKHKHRFHSGKKDYHPNLDGFAGVPKMNIAVLITGSRGDVQPFIALGQTLQKPPYSHRVRLCTHPVFKDFVEENGLEFFSIGGDPAALMAYMVKNPGVLPSMKSFKAGDIGHRKAELAEMLEGAWRACTQGGDGMTTIDLTLDDGEPDILMRLPPPFVADAIIANPPTYAHIHIAEKLAVPLHLMFTMPWSPTGAFPHPLANLDASKVDARIANQFSYTRMEYLTWAGLADIINHFREKTLMLDAISPAWGHSLFPHLKVPFTYCWSEALIPKPSDWGSHITISGFSFLSLSSSYKPDPALLAFLDAGPPPVYIGFGSIVVDDPEALTQMIFEAVKLSGVRALVSKGWGNVGGSNPPDNIFLLGNVPHDWLFPRVSAVVHHGGAGTTAIGIALGKPTVIVPFFGDQPWWAGMVFRAGAGPEAVPYKKLTAEKLAENITRALQPDIRAKAHELSMKMKDEDGAKTAAESFHAMPQMKNVGCFICPDRVAVWRLRKTNVQLSALAAGVLVTRGKVKPEHFKLVRHKRWYVDEGAQDPFIGVFGAFMSTTVGLVTDMDDYKKELWAPLQPKPSPHQEQAGQTQGENSKTSSSLSKALNEQAAGAGSRRASSESRRSVDDERSASPGAHDKHHSSSKSKRFASATGHLAESSAAHALRAPVALMYNVANGFHNAPAHYFRDHTVRVRDNITGLSSGLKVGGKELGYGLYDGFSGLVTQPYKGYRDADGEAGAKIAGLSKGVGRGLGGLVFKTGAAVMGLPSYGLKGLEREVERWWTGSDALTRSETAIIQRAREDANQHGLGKGDGSMTAKTLMWDEAKGAGVGKRILERRVWQGYRELRELALLGDEGERVVQSILDRWDRLKVDEGFLAGLVA